ncbi:MAG TPA: hypothetical protein VNM92_06775 [Thermoanaerobaculia bacterium]|nr:hypothetical protein [Thermoanaerobaculia bacterium]
MRTRTLLLYSIAAVAAVTSHAAPALFTTPTKSEWSVMNGKSTVGSVTLFSEARNSRAEWKADRSAAPIVFIGTSGKIWVRTVAGGDVELDSYKGGIESTIVPALLLPVTSTTSDDVAVASGKISSYHYRGARASYRHDTKGVSAVDLKAGSQQFVLARTSVGGAKADATLYVVRPRKAAASRMARLSGDLFAPSKGTVAATAGTRGVEKGFKFADGGDYAALEKIEARDMEWQARLKEALAEFQREGKVGEEQP